MTGERLSFGECLLAGGMLLASLFFRLKGQELLPRQESKE
ncbi:hypothetical protein [Parageobacillus thermantarcticus]